MLGNHVALSYDFFARNWMSFSYRYMVIYKPEDEKLLKAIVGDQWNDMIMRRSLYERTKADAIAQNTNFTWLAYGEAAYSYGMFEEAVMAFEKGLAMGSAQAGQDGGEDRGGERRQQRPDHGPPPAEATTGCLPQCPSSVTVVRRRS